MSIVFELPMLYGEAQTGKIKIYKVSVVDNGDGSFSVMREHGQQGGKTQIDEKRVATGKNIGKANETTPKDQAIAEAKSYWQKKLDSNYSENPDQTAPKENLLPMLAHPYKDYGHRMQFPCGGQVKLNGVPIAIFINHNLLGVIHDRFRQVFQQVLQFGWFHHLPRYALAACVVFG